MDIVNAVQVLTRRCPELSGDDSIKQLLLGKVSLNQHAFHPPCRQPPILAQTRHPSPPSAASDASKLHALRCLPLYSPLPAYAACLQLTLKETLAVLAGVVIQPLYTLPAASAFRSSILRLTSALVEAHIKQHLPHTDAAAFTVALITLLELAPHISK